MDDLYEGWTGVDSGVDLLHNAILEPLSRGFSASYNIFDWTADRRGDTAEHRRIVRPSDLIVEGCHSAQRKIGHLNPLLIWVEAPDDLRLARGLARDGASAEPFWLRFMSEERSRYAEERTWERATVRIDAWGAVVN